MGKRATYIFILILSLALLGFTSSRSIDLLQLFLPPGQEGWAWLGLAAFDVGLLGWSLFFAHGAQGSYQRAIALIMVILSLLAVAVSTIMDMLIASADKGVITALPDAVRVLVLLVVGLIVVANVVAFFLTHITDPEHLKAMATEAARSKIHDEVLRQINERAPQVAAKVAPHLTEQWVRRTVAELAPELESAGDAAGRVTFLSAPAQSQEAQNGHHKTHSARNGSPN